jgi:hypothetical protein
MPTPTFNHSALPLKNADLVFKSLGITSKVPTPTFKSLGVASKTLTSCSIARHYF